VIRTNQTGSGHRPERAKKSLHYHRIISSMQRQVRDAHPNLKAADIKRRIANWAQMSEKQIGRILGRCAE
jgi:hypothetical protein